MLWPGTGSRHKCAPRVQIVEQKGKLQKVNVMVCTYNEPMETVRECVQYLLDSPEPVYASKHIYIGDDGAKKKFECSDQKRQMVDEFRRRARPSPHRASRCAGERGSRG